MKSKNFLHYLFLLTAVLLHITDWFLDNVYLRILAGLAIIIAINKLPIKKTANKDRSKKLRQGDDSVVLSEEEQ